MTHRASGADGPPTTPGPLPRASLLSMAEDTGWADYEYPEKYVRAEGGPSMTEAERAEVVKELRNLRGGKP